MHIWCNFREVTVCYSKSMRYRDCPIKNESRHRNASAKNRKRSQRFPWPSQLNWLLYYQIENHLGDLYSSCLKKISQWSQTSIAKLPSRKSRFTSWILLPVPSMLERPLLMYLAFHETSMGCMLSHVMNRVRKNRQFITWVRSSPIMILVILPWKNLFCFAMGNEATALYPVSHHIVDFSNGFGEVLIKKSVLSRILARQNLLLAYVT